LINHTSTDDANSNGIPEVTLEPTINSDLNADNLKEIDFEGSAFSSGSNCLQIISIGLCRITLAKLGYLNAVSDKRRLAPDQ
jgi:hypothetical protein